MSTTTVTRQARAKEAVLAPSAARHQGRRRSIDIALYTFVIVMVLLYAPISATFFFVGPQIAYVGDKYYEYLVSWDFAYGDGSGHPDRPLEGYTALMRNAAAMAPHSVLGTVAILIGLLQFNNTLQYKYPVIHRNLGRVYGFCSAAMTASSAVFLFDTIPKKDVFSGELFALSLSSLSLGNALTMTLAVLFVWAKDVPSHREFMALNYSLMLSAPLLRVLWIIFGRLWGETKYVVNLYTGLLSGPFLLSVPIFYLRRHYVRPASKPLTSTSLRLAIVAGSALSLLFLTPKLSTAAHWTHRPEPDFWFTVPQFAFQVIAFAWMGHAAYKRGDMGSYTAWRTYQNGLLSAPIFAVPSYYVCRDIMGCPDSTLGLGTALGGWQTGLAMSFFGYVIATSKFVVGTNGRAKAA